MSVYMCLVVVALMVPAVDSAKCVFPDQYEITLQEYFQNSYMNMSTDNTLQLEAATKYSLDGNGKPTVTKRIVDDYKRLIKTIIPVNGPCKRHKLNEEIVTEIPDNAVKVEYRNLHLTLPPDLPEGIEYWRFKLTDKKEIVGVLRISSKICVPVVWGKYNDNEITKEKVSYIRGYYSLRIQNRNVFKVPTKCNRE